ncbi:hypothetical protein TRICI_005845 [Trichomonascus ciferrii]|uniref:Uncharacterized protein n=1 Tax=Trichomonascus ciferrii TaxID=44093 RepID=A0A642UNS6_9ASCO|nr:hypothetical protein TRICI_005845 [Trichomonascus ciferrii]
MTTENLANQNPSLAKWVFICQKGTILFKRTLQRMGVEEFALMTIEYGDGRSRVENRHSFELLEGSTRHMEGIPSGPIGEIEQSVLMRVFKENKHKTRLVNFVDFARFVNDPILFPECKKLLLNFLLCCDRDRGPQKEFNLYLGYGSYYYMPFKSIEPVVPTLGNLKDLMYAYLSIDKMPATQGGNNSVLYLGENIHGLQLDLDETEHIPSEWMVNSIRTLLIRSACPRRHFNQLAEHVQKGDLDSLRVIQVIKGPKMDPKDLETLTQSLKQKLYNIESERQTDNKITTLMDPIGRKETN